MKKFILMALMTIVCAMNASAQYTSGIREGFLNNEISGSLTERRLPSPT